MNKTLIDFIKPLITDDFDEVMKVADKLARSDIHSLSEFREIITKLAGYLFYAGTMAGRYSATRRKVYSKTYNSLTGTIADKENIAEVACADAREKEEIFGNMFKTIKEQIDALKKVWEIKQVEWQKSGKEV